MIDWRPAAPSPDRDGAPAAWVETPRVFVPLEPEAPEPRLGSAVLTKLPVRPEDLLAALTRHGEHPRPLVRELARLLRADEVVLFALARRGAR